MRPLAHLNLGIFTGLLAQYFFGWRIGVIVFVFQLIPLIDIFLEILIKKEPFHNVFAMVIMSALVASYSIFAAWLAFASYALHIIVDTFVEEGVELFYPFTKKTTKFPVWHSEDIVIAISALGILILVIKFFF